MRSFPSAPTGVKAALEQQPISRISTTEREAGFTLLEVVAVMAIIALVASLVFTVVPGTGRAQLKALAMQTAALLRRERLDAILTGRARRVSLDRKQRALVGDGRNVVLIPRDVVLDVVGVNELRSGPELVARFEPDGTSTGAVLKLSRQRAEYEISVNWYTGAVAIISY